MLNSLHANGLFLQPETGGGVWAANQFNRLSADTAETLLVPSQPSPDGGTPNPLIRYRAPVIAAQIFILLCLGLLIKRGIDYLRAVSTDPLANNKSPVQQNEIEAHSLEPYSGAALETSAQTFEVIPVPVSPSVYEERTPVR
ncbi:MAG: hypothetical protein ACFBSF_19475 [Leptolyngbyaceae cyanobacterium]